jgi:ubiquinone/menaquinone biosynthesis C-methylase UbiE
MLDATVIERFTGFSRLYDQNRPQPPEILIDLVLDLLKKKKARLVIDLGSGTGLSTFIWSPRARQVIGIEPNVDMRWVAIKNAKAGGYDNVSFKCADSYHVPISRQSADIVVCSQSFHWMEPKATLKEVNRVLKPGGIFLTCDCDWPPTIDYMAEQAYRLLSKKIAALEAGLGQAGRVPRWDKSRHLENIRQSGYFRYTKEILLHKKDQGHAARFIDLALSQGSIQTLLKSGVSPKKMGLTDFISAVNKSIGRKKLPMYFSYRIRIGIK